jgi:HK97 family phage portal protein
MVKYFLTDANGKVQTVRPEDILHITGLGFDGLRSQSVLRHALRNPAGIAYAADEYSGRFFQNGARPDFAITMAGSPTPDQLANLRASWSDRYGGASKSHLPAVLTGGMDVKQLTMSAEDTQLIETRQFQVEDIARVFGVPPFMIGHTEKTTSWGAGVEQMSIGFVKYTLQRHLTKFEQEINRKFWRRDTGYFAEFAVEGLLRGDAKTRSEFYRSALGGSAGPAWMSTNEVRRLENLPPVDGGDTLTEWKASNGQSQPAAAARA